MLCCPLPPERPGDIGESRESWSHIPSQAVMEHRKHPYKDHSCEISGHSLVEKYMMCPTSFSYIIMVRKGILKI